MKLNLLPTTVSTANRGRNALIGSILLVLLSGGATAFMAISSSEYLRKQTEYEASALPGAQQAATVAKQGDAVMAEPSVAMLVKNVALARAMNAHNDKYPRLYNDLRPYIPAFFRLTSLSATPLTGGGAPQTPAAPPAPGTPAAAPAGGGTSTVNMQGVIRTYQEYADLMLALLRIPGAQSVSRAGFTGVDPEVPPVSEFDQNGRPRKAGEDPIPDDPLERLAYFTDRPKEEGYLNSGGFGSGEEGLRTITPNASLVSVQVVVARDLQTPDPRATLGTMGGAPAGGAPGGGVPTPAGGAGAPGGGPPGVGAIPSARGAASAAGGGRTGAEDE